MTIEAAATIHPQHVTITLNGEQVDSGRLLSVVRDTILIAVDSGRWGGRTVTHGYTFVPGMTVAFTA